MNTYTREEYKALYDTIDPIAESFLRPLLKAAVGLEITYQDPYMERGKDKVYKNFKDCVKERFGFVYPIMYTIPTDELPLYINETSNMLFKTIVRWRLSIGK